MSENLTVKRCPYCGEQAEMVQKSSRNGLRFHAECVDEDLCGLTGPSHGDHDHALGLWNELSFVKKDDSK